MCEYRVGISTLRGRYKVEGSIEGSKELGQKVRMSTHVGGREVLRVNLSADILAVVEPGDEDCHFEMQTGNREKKIPRSGLEVFLCFESLRRQKQSVVRGASVAFAVG
jgi:hypothetical protein